MKSGSLLLLEPSGPVKACNGIALPLPLHKNSRRIFSRVSSCSLIEEMLFVLRNLCFFSEERKTGFYKNFHRSLRSNITFCGIIIFNGERFPPPSLPNIETEEPTVAVIGIWFFNTVAHFSSV
jgi:hypothetical protein